MSTVLTVLGEEEGDTLASISSMLFLCSNVTRTYRLAAICAAAAEVFLAGCSREPTAIEQPGKPPGRVYEVRGIVRGAPDMAARNISIEHEDIPGFMPSMTMPFEFRNPNEVEGLSPDESIAFKLSVTDDDSWISDIRRIRPASVNRVAPAKPAPPPSTVERFKEGARLPGFELVDQSGCAIRPESFAGKPLLLTFIFTRCPIPNFCPRMSQNFRLLQQAFRAEAALANRVNLLSISFDERDTPAVLSEYGATFSDDFASWRFATGKPEEIRKLTRGFAVLVQPDGATINHGLATALVDAGGVIRNIWRGNGWQTDEVLTALRKLEVKLTHEVTTDQPPYETETR